MDDADVVDAGMRASEAAADGLVTDGADESSRDEEGSAYDAMVPPPPKAMPLPGDVSGSGRKRAACDAAGDDEDEDDDSADGPLPTDVEPVAATAVAL